MDTKKQLAPNVSIARATLEDADAILLCMSAAFEPFRPQYTPPAYEDTIMNATTVRSRIEMMTVLVARDNTGGIVGTIGARQHGAEGHIRGMAVVPSMQGSGIADRLLGAIEQQLIAAGCTFVTLDTTAPLTRAIRFYERRGYTLAPGVSDFFGMKLYRYQKQLNDRSS